jgi:hypothetical protein
VSDAIAALIPPAVMAVIFVVLLVTAYRATDGANRGKSDRTGPPTSKK